MERLKTLASKVSAICFFCVALDGNWPAFISAINGFLSLCRRGSRQFEKGLEREAVSIPSPPLELICEGGLCVLSTS